MTTVLPVPYHLESLLMNIDIDVLVALLTGVGIGGIFTIFVLLYVYGRKS